MDAVSVDIVKRSKFYHEANALFVLDGDVLSNDMGKRSDFDYNVYVIPEC